MKRNSSKIVIGLIVVALLAWSIYGGLSQEEKTTSTDKVKVGAILPLTGELGLLGTQMQRGMELALADNQDVGIELVYEDDQSFDNRQAVTAVNKLINVDKVSLVLNSVVNTIKAIGPVLNQSQVPGVVFWDNNKELFAQGEYVFGMGFSTEQAGQDMADFAYNKLGARHVAVITILDEWSEMISREFIDKFTALGGKIDSQDKVQIEQADFRTQISRVKRADSDAIYFPLLPQTINHLVKQAREMGYEGEYLSADGFSDFNIEVLGEAAEGIYLTQLWLEDQSFLDKYKDRYKEDVNPLNLAFSAISYDAVKVAVDMVKYLRINNISVTPQAIKDNLVGFKSSGVTGNTEFSAEQTVSKRELIYKIKEGTLQLAN